MLVNPDPKTIVIWTDGNGVDRISCACEFQDKPHVPELGAAQHNNRQHYGTYKVKDMR